MLSPLEIYSNCKYGQGVTWLVHHFSLTFNVDLSVWDWGWDWSVVEFQSAANQRRHRKPFESGPVSSADWHVARGKWNVKHNKIPRTGFPRGSAFSRRLNQIWRFTNWESECGASLAEHVLMTLGSPCFPWVLRSRPRRCIRSPLLAGSWSRAAVPVIAS